MFKTTYLFISALGVCIALTSCSERTGINLLEKSADKIADYTETHERKIGKAIKNSAEYAYNHSIICDTPQGSCTLSSPSESGSSCTCINTYGQALKGQTR